MSGSSAVFKQTNKKESPNNKRQHIRFDREEEEDDNDHQKKKDGDGVITSSSKAATANNDLPSSNNSQKRKKKRKRSATTTPSDTNDGNNVTTTNKHQEDKIFNGLILALSTDNKQHQSDNNNSNNNKEEEDDPYNNLKSLKTILQSHGATISPQVHKRVHYLICTPWAITNLTQRIRQAMKRNVDIVSVDWVKNCVDEKRRVDVVATSESDEKYLWNDWAREIMVEKECEKKRTSANNNKNNSANSNNNNDDGGYNSDNIPQEDDDDNRGWSTPVQLDCCCVCHENGDLNCPWCSECNINLAMKKTTKEEENI